MTNKPYPKGAISTINELLTFTDRFLWHVSRKFCGTQITPSCKEHFTGRIGVKVRKPDPRYLEEGNDYYHWYECIHHNCQKPSTHSLLDANVIENDYNDWYLFGDHADAEAWLKREGEA